MTRSGHKRMSREALLELPSFNDETVYCEAMHEPEDVLYSGSDDECYESPAARLHCYEDQARQFLQGKQPFLLSASMRGPFGKESGWKNPWRGKGGRSVISKPKRPRTRESVSAPNSAAQALSRESTSHSGVASQRSHVRSQSPSGSEQWCSSTLKPEKRIAAESSWLRRDNLKRPTSSHDDDVFAMSPTKAIHRSKSRKLADSTRAFSEPVEVDDSAVFGGIRDLISDEPPSWQESAGEKSATRSQNADIGRATSLPADCSPGKEVSPPDTAKSAGQDTDDLQGHSVCSDLNSSHGNEVEDKPSTPISDAEAAISGHDQVELQLDEAANIASTDASETEDPVPDTLSIGETDAAQETYPPPPFDGTTLVSADHEDSAEEDVLMRNTYETEDSLNLDVVDETADLSSFEGSVSMDMPEKAHTVVSRLLLKLEALSSQNMPETPVDAYEDSAADENLDAATTTDTEESRLTTQDQSPWAKGVDIPPSPCQTAVEPVEPVEEPPVLENLEAEPDQPQPDKNSLEALTRVQTQSPWFEEPSLDAPFLGRKGLSSGVPVVESAILRRNTDGDVRVSLSQNPWVEEFSREHHSFSSSLPDRLISPCSPNSREPPQTPNRQQEEVTLPPLSAVLVPSSLGTAPSTPETKQSSLPTPDLTVSIKSFRRFRSPTPTPPPRQRTKQSGGLRSVLVHPRSRRNGSPSNKHSRRVRFDVQEPGEGAESNALFAYHYGMADDEDDEISEDRTYSGKSGASLHRGQRAASPPPQDAVMAGVLPSEVEKFRGHFATVTNRSQWQAAAKDTTEPAEFNLRALGQCKGALSDEFGSNLLSTEAMSETSRLQGRPSQDRQSTSRKEHDSFGEDKENSQEMTHHEESHAEEADNASNVDDVEEVLQNLGDFLGMWDVDTELAKI